jgi:hypothetical protein
LKKEEATGLLGEIINVCDGLSEQAVMLMPPDADDVLSHGYQLPIKPMPNNMACIRPLVEKRNLAIAEENRFNVLPILSG